MQASSGQRPRSRGVGELDAFAPALVKPRGIAATSDGDIYLESEGALSLIR